MLTNLLNRFRSSTPTSSRPQTQYFRLHKKDGEYSADPKNLEQLDDFEAHTAAAKELNGYNAQFEMVRERALSLEGTQSDLNPREDVVAVSNIDVNGRSVDAVMEHSRDFPKLEARVNDHGGTLTITQRGYYKEQNLTFDDGKKTYEIADEFDNSYVSVKLKSNG